MAKLTPMMVQYNEIKRQYEDCILMFRLGDFYEMFFEDAVVAAEILQITLTSRNKGAAAEAKMCGIPYHALDNYLYKLTQAGKKVALCDQVTKPDGKGIVQREVVRVVTPGTTFDEHLLDKKSNNFIACIVGVDRKWGLSFADNTTGEFKVTEIQSLKDLESQLMKIQASELIVSDKFLEKNPGVSAILNKMKTIHIFTFQYAKDAGVSLRKYFDIRSLEVFGLDGKDLAVRSAGMLYEYLRETQKTELKHINKISYFENSKYMPLDETCIRNLELFYTNRDAKKEGSLVWVLDQTACAMGGRMLRNWLIHPLLEKEEIDDRLSKIDIFVKDSSLLREIREELKSLYDVERLLSRLSIGSGNARDLIAMKLSLEKIPMIKEKLKSLLGRISSRLDPLPELTSLIEKAIADEAPISLRDGGMIKTGYNSELDDLRSISSEGKGFIQSLQEREIKRTGINSMKVKFNKVFGYYIEISKTNLASVPDDYIRKQTLVNAERYITPELKEYEEKVLNAEDRIKELEYDLFYKVRMEVVKEIVNLQKNARALAELDVLSNFAYIAVKNNYARPEILDENLIDIIDGRHPVVEQIGFAQNFVPNDCKMNELSSFQLITGPNMGGKSTYLRQVALTVLMAQIGCFVPAKIAKIGIVDRIFTRVGASDNLVRGQSTFMVEMQEAAYILNNASDRSLIILDEIGRGTSTYDGVSIAWAISEFIHDRICAKTLFATHYHELVDLVKKLPHGLNLSVAVRENQEEGVVFLYKIVDGGVDKSYGIEVAKLAGLSVDIVSRARGVLSQLEEKSIGNKSVNKDQINMFEKGDSRTHTAIKESDNQIYKELRDLDVNNLTPIQALEQLNSLKKKLK